MTEEHQQRGAKRRRSDTPGLEGGPFEDVLAAAMGGQGWAFNALYNWLSRPITAFVSSKGLSDPGPAVNETFLGAFRGLNRFSGNAEDFRRWVFGIARHKIVDAQRAEYRQPDSAMLVEDLGQRVDGANVEQEVIINLSTERVSALLDVLTVEQREVLTLRLVSDMSVAQIAETLGKPAGAVKALQRRAIRRLAQNVDAATLQQVVS